MKEQVCGDGPNLVLSLAHELMVEVQRLIKVGQHPSEILIGHKKTINKVYITELESQTCYTLPNMYDHD